MRKRVFLSTVMVALILVTTFSTTSLGGDTSGDYSSPSWSMYGRDPQHTSLASFSIDGIDGAVETKISGYSLSGTPVIDGNGMIYVSSTYRGVYCFDPHGNVRWTFRTGESVRGTPAFSDEGTLYLATYSDFWAHEGSGNYLYSIDTDGYLNWKRPTGGGGSMFGPCVGENGNIYLGTTNGDLLAFNDEGVLLWRFNAEDDVISTPAVDGNGSIYFSCYDGYLYCLSSDGQLKWRFPIGGQQYSSPSISDDGNIYFGSSNGKVYAIDPGGEEIWNYSTNGSIYRGLALGPDGSIYVQSGSKLQRIDVDGSLIWEVDGEYYSQFNQVPTVDLEGNVIIEVCLQTDQDRRYYLECYDSDGVFRFSFRFDGDYYDKPFPASITDEGKILVVNDDQGLYIIGNDPNIDRYLTMALEIVLIAVAVAAIAFIYRRGARP